MKKLLLIALLAFSLGGKSQIVFEHAYDSAATHNFCATTASQLMLVNLEVSGERYIVIDRCGKQMKLYDINHSLVKNISLASVPFDWPSAVGAILYISENLFNTDTLMEFMYITTNPTYHTYIYNENLNVLFSDTGAAMVIPNFHIQQLPIYNTSQGTKMILSYRNGTAKVFGLAGTLTTAIQPNGHLPDLSEMGVSNPVPNPVAEQTKINYVLPQSISEADLVLYDMQGNELRRYRVDKTFDHILVSTTEVAAGTYFYQLQANGQSSGAKKMIVIR
jgi:hypothetical protein